MTRGGKKNARMITNGDERGQQQQAAAAEESEGEG